MVELTLMVNPLERTARLREVHALAAGDLCTLTVSGVPGALPGLQLALYRDASMESLVASVAEFSPVPGHSRDRAGTLDLGAAEMEEWFEDEVAAARRKASRRVSSLGSLPSAASLSDESSDGLPPRASPDMPAEGWLVLFDAERTWVSCPVSVLLRKVEVASGGVEPVLTLLAMKVDKVPSASAGNVPTFVGGGGIADSGVPAAPDASLSAPGRYADAKAVGDALRGGYTEWEVVPDGVRLVFADGGWYPYQGALDIGQRRGDADSTELEWSGVGQDVPFRIVAVRRRITPTKTSHLENDGDGTAPFVLSTDERLAAMASTGGKLYGAAAYPAWSPDIGYEGDGTVVSYAGRLWESYATSDFGDRPTEHPESFREKTIGELKQDALSSAQKAAVNSGATAAKVAAWDGYAAQIAGKAGAADVNAALAQKANTSDLRYDLVTVQNPGATVQLGDRASTRVSLTLAVSSETGWTWDDGVDRGAPTRHEDEYGYVYWSCDGMDYMYEDGDTVWFYHEYYNEEYDYMDMAYFSATKTTVYSIDTVIPVFTVPDPVPNKARDFVLDLSLDDSALEGTGLEMPAVSFSPGTGGTFLADDGNFPAPEAGRNLYSFTEVAQNVFAVSHRMVEAVS